MARECKSATSDCRLPKEESVVVGRGKTIQGGRVVIQGGHSTTSTGGAFSLTDSALHLGAQHGQRLAVGIASRVPRSLLYGARRRIDWRMRDWKAASASARSARELTPNTSSASATTTAARRSRARARPTTSVK